MTDPTPEPCAIQRAHPPHRRMLGRRVYRCPGREPAATPDLRAALAAADRNVPARELRVGDKGICRHCSEEIVWEPWFRDGRGPNPPVWSHTRSGTKSCNVQPADWPPSESWPFAEPVACGVCGSDNVVYRNYLEQPFCGPCADGDQPADCPCGHDADHHDAASGCIECPCRPAGAPSELEQLRQRAEAAEAALAALHEGEEQPPYMNTNTPGEWIWRWNRATPEHRQALAARVLNRGNQSALKRAHAALAEQAGKDQAALARVRAFLDRDQVGLCCSRLIGQLRYLVGQSCCCDHGADRHDGDGECQICNCPHTEEPRP